MRILAGILIGWILVVAAGAAYIYSGLYDIAATKPHNPLVRWAFDTTMERSVAARAEEVEVPDEFTEAQVQQGFDHFRETCVMCHGAPGAEPSEVGKGLTPDPPRLSDAAEEKSSAELFWIAKHGIKMTAMPAFGPTHEDRDLWAVVAFLERLPDLTPQQYDEMARTADAAQEGRPNGTRAAE